MVGLPSLSKATFFGIFFPVLAATLNLPLFIIDTEVSNMKGILEDVGVISKLDPSMPEYWDQNGDRARPMLNTSQLQRLHNGAIVQQRLMFETLKEVAEEMLPGFASKLNERLESKHLPALPV